MIWLARDLEALLRWKGLVHQMTVRFCGNVDAIVENIRLLMERALEPETQKHVDVPEANRGPKESSTANAIPVYIAYGEICSIGATGVMILKNILITADEESESAKIGITLSLS